LLVAPAYAHLTAGHREGRADGFYNVAGDIYGVIPGDAAHQPSTICSFADAYRSSCALQAMLESHSEGGALTTVSDLYPAVRTSSNDSRLSLPLER
jgi:hypothetical protein